MDGSTRSFRSSAFSVSLPEIISVFDFGGSILRLQILLDSDVTDVRYVYEHFDGPQRRITTLRGKQCEHPSRSQSEWGYHIYVSGGHLPENGAPWRRLVPVMACFDGLI